MDEIKKVKKPWGEFWQFTQNKKSTVKTLIVKKGARLSYQKHKRRKEMWFVIKGHVGVIKGTTKHILTTHGHIIIEKNELHRLIGLEDSIVLEISFGRFNEKDITRLADDYNRT